MNLLDLNRLVGHFGQSAFGSSVPPGDWAALAAAVPEPAAVGLLTVPILALLRRRRA